MVPMARKIETLFPLQGRMCWLIIILLLQPFHKGAALEYACNFDKDDNLKSMRFCDTSLSDEIRVFDLVSRLTLEEKVTQLVNTASAIPRLSIPAYEWWQEGLHGVAHVSFGGSLPRATSFPLPILTTASFNKDLWNQIGQVVSTEARAFYNDGIAGLTYWSPVINIARDPRWGRIQETSGEDPYTTSAYATHFVQGMQEGDANSKRLKLSACCKHFTAYDVDNWEGIDRYHFDAKVTLQDLADTYNPPFQSCVQEGRSASLMCSYNKVNGVPTCANYDFLENTVRRAWGLNGYIVSDCDSVLVMHESTNYAPTTEDAAADALNAGLDLNCGDYLASYTEGAVAMGKVNASRVDNAVYNVFLVRMRLGMFDGNPANQEFGNIGVADVCTPAHQELAVEAARQGIVLLKNDGNILPLSKNINTAVIGPNANATHTMLGNYEGIPCQYITPLQGLVKFGSGDYHKVWFSEGCVNTACQQDDQISSAVSTAAVADAVVLVVGLSQVQESEALDRTSLLLPGYQQTLIDEVAGAAAGRPVVLVLMCAGPVDINFAKNDKRIQSILWVGYPGQSGGQAIAEVIFGAHNPGGKLPMSWYPEDYTKISMTNMNMRPDSRSNYPGRTYRFYTGEKIYDFGYGLSYTEYKHSFALAPTTVMTPSIHSQLCDPHQTSAGSSLPCSQAHQETCSSSNFDVHINVENIGAMAGNHTLLLFFTAPSAGKNGTPLKQLAAFDSVYIRSGSQEKVVLTLNPCQHLGTVAEDGTRMLEAGNHILSVGDAKHSLSVLFSDTSGARY
ncbi:beta-xylosidase/alpha-L-arabinofuranosidase 1 [Physcomitrium patens]|uniref:Fibronectin type III-like domain-containing protein n=1 Tax=Physcomitrium patens TaxID=3218 RepID=A0A2K1IUW5_PHYPA|nr:beta-xylosidase/alpha-L-arabinofuranosidase 1-like [Physcomitrium patens]XP_024356913.1 beta-xylosidase/alpha-L-arabinofuranosidase 1-like [Physcomitrium patens]PNR33069.1 hypothetical protein PHYPA_025012 [Physcomitrium patens]|eukprot:XP_024356912.1 beta-xylosidase/alpha-L-arabinofuranosidase 1-like [Physcomitrella patens]